MNEKKVLLIGSEEYLLNKVDEYLTAQGYLVKTVAYTEDAVDEAVHWQPELVFLQALVDSSGLDLREVLSEFEKKEVAQHALTIVFTPQGQDIDTLKEIGGLYSESIIYQESPDLIRQIEEFLKRSNNAGNLETDISKKKILVVDDSALQRKFMISMIQQAGFNHSIMEAQNGNEAIEILGRNYKDIGLILCDWNMPELSGIQFIEALAKIPPLDQIPLLMVTAKTSAEDEKEAYAKHPKLAGYLEKPFTTKKFTKAVKEYLS
ncbi:MAG: response regulator [Candidatus Omnitrophica bacterium]|nr:response regulator [Candidatus Omnitrophota bacterium]